MPPESIANPIHPETRKLLGDVRDLLLEQHKLLLDRERVTYEKEHGAIEGPGPYLALVLGDAHFAWLKTISSLVVEIDEALSRRSLAGQPVADALLAQARETMQPVASGTDFQIQYQNAVEASSASWRMHARIAQLLG